MSVCAQARILQAPSIMHETHATCMQIGILSLCMHEDTVHCSFACKMFIKIINSVSVCMHWNISACMLHTCGNVYMYINNINAQGIFYDIVPFYNNHCYTGRVKKY